MGQLNKQELESALANPRVRAFLDAIASAEGTRGRGNDGYNISVGGKTFEGYDRHPHRIVQLNSWLRSDAAGRYQFMSYTWDPLSRQLGLRDFSPRNQDIGALALIAEKGALNDVLAGNIQGAVYKVRKVWASLPEANYPGQRGITLDRFMGYFSAALSAVKNVVVGAAEVAWDAIKRAGRVIAGDPKDDTACVPQPHCAGSAAERSYSGYPSLKTTAWRADLVALPRVGNTTPGNSETNVVIGDSIGVGMRWLYPGILNVAEIGKSIKGAITQLARVPRGSIADVYLGTNNGPYTPEQVRAETVEFLRAAEAHGVRINNWILPGRSTKNVTLDRQLDRVAVTIAETIRDYNQHHYPRKPIHVVEVRSKGISLAGDGLHLSLTGCRQVKSCIDERSSYSATTPKAIAPIPLA